MIPAYAKPAHRRLRAKLADIAAWNDAEGPNRILEPEETAHGSRPALGIVASGIAVVHAREAAPAARLLAVGLTYPLPLATLRAFAASVERLLVLEEGDPVLLESLRAAGIPCEGKPEPYRFGELEWRACAASSPRSHTSPEPVPPKGKPPEFCPGCSHRTVFETLRT